MTASIFAVVLLEAAEAVAFDVVFAVVLMVLVAVTATVAAAVLATVAKLVLSPCSIPDVSGAVCKGVVDRNIFTTCHSAEGYISDRVGGMMRRGLDLR